MKSSIANDVTACNKYLKHAYLNESHSQRYSLAYNILTYYYYVIMILSEINYEFNLVSVMFTE